MRNAEEYYVYVCNTLADLMAVDSPTGYPQAVCARLEEYLEEMGYSSTVSNKRLVKVSVKGKSSAKRVALSAHVDTLGAMVKGVDGDGKIRFTTLGGPILPTWDGEYCVLHADGGKTYTGTFLSDSPSCHVYRDAGTKERNEGTMYVRIDENVSSAADVAALGIRTGSVIAVETKTRFTDSGYVKSRFLDDKAGSVCLLTVLQAIKEEGLVPEYDTDFYFTNYEEVGHGASTLDDADELLAVDMGCVGAGLACKETQVSVCVKDGRGPYDFEMVERLISLCKQNGIDYAADVYPYYGSDVGAAYSAGKNLKGALIGPGVHASHGMERTHLQGIYNTVALIAAYLGL